MRSALLLCNLLVVVIATTRWYQLNDYNFEKYVAEFNKVYGEEEHLRRKEIFDAALSRITFHNLQERSWKEGVNHMTDWTTEEFQRLLGYKKGAANHLSKRVKMTPKDSYDITSLPGEVDWRTKNVVTAVKDQGLCGSCWSFGTAETVESHWALKTGRLEALSEQQILDCTPNPKQCGGTGGCGGGTAELAMARIIEMGGLASEWTYPYRSYFGQGYSCQFNGSTKPMAVLSDYKVLPSNNYAALLEAIATVGPVAISVDASSWQFYESGVYNGCNQTHPDIDHSVQLVGYGIDQDHKMGYWLVRNSWNPTWGEQGYIRIYRNSQPTCGWDLTPRDGDACRNGPKEQLVCGHCGILFDTAYPIIKQ